MVRLPGAPRSPTASRPCGIGLDLSLAGLGVWTLARPAAWQLGDGVSFSISLLGWPAWSRHGLGQRRLLAPGPILIWIC